jgi:hypothetical protein
MPIGVGRMPIGVGRMPIGVGRMPIGYSFFSKMSRLFCFL